MGMKSRMTIEEAKEILKAYDFSFTGCTGSLKEAISTVLPIVEKHQKIEQICKENCDLFSTGAIEKVKAVLEDGNDR